METDSGGKETEDSGLPGGDRATTREGQNYLTLRSANVARQAQWCPEQVPDLSFRGNELAGETGEVCNVIKKLERERQGWRGSRDTVEHLAEELADVVICADLIGIAAGIDLEAAVALKFNATSEKVGLPHRLTPSDPNGLKRSEASDKDSPSAETPVALDESTRKGQKNLLPCPFCGDPRASVEWEPCAPISEGDTNRLWFVECARCGAQGPVRDRENQCKEPWNKRAGTSVSDGGGSEASSVSSETGNEQLARELAEHLQILYGYQVGLNDLVPAILDKLQEWQIPQSPSPSQPAANTGKELTIPIYNAAKVKPAVYEVVILAGGIGRWNGKYWETCIGRDHGRPISWNVEWWTPLILGLPSVPSGTDNQTGKDLEKPGAVSAATAVLQKALGVNAADIWNTAKQLAQYRDLPYYNFLNAAVGILNKLVIKAAVPTQRLLSSHATESEDASGSPKSESSSSSSSASVGAPVEARLREALRTAYVFAKMHENWTPERDRECISALATASSPVEAIAKRLLESWQKYGARWANAMSCSGLAFPARKSTG